MNNRGFSLIELLVVMIILSITLAIIGPMTIEQVDKANARSELTSFKNTLKAMSNQAFSTSEAIALSLSNKVMKTNAGNKESKHTFEFISFPEQIIYFNHNGYPEPHLISVEQNGQSAIIDFYEIAGMKGQEVIILE
jgi:prepilin-type N-terminal cleavage/methylation domain-containing protein